MRKSRIFFILLSLTSLVFAKPASIPEWVTNHRAVYPDNEYLAQRGSGKSAEMAKTDAASALARYFQMNVSANLSTTMHSITSGDFVEEKTIVADDVRVSSEVSLFTLEYTESYYHKKEKKWYCVAFIKRESAWKQYRPQIELALKTFLGQYESALAEPDPFTRLSCCKTAWVAGGELLNKLEYGRIISPKDEAAYSTERDKLAQIPVMFEATKKECTVFVAADSEHNHTLTQAVSTALTRSGLTVTKTADEANYVADIAIEDNVGGNELLSIMPSMSMKITSKEGNTVYSYEATTAEKTFSYTLGNARKKAYPKLAGEIEDALKNDLVATFKL